MCCFCFRQKLSPRGLHTLLSFCLTCSYNPLPSWPCFYSPFWVLCRCTLFQEALCAPSLLCEFAQHFLPSYFCHCINDSVCLKSCFPTARLGAPGGQRPLLIESVHPVPNVSMCSLLFYLFNDRQALEHLRSNRTMLSNHKRVRVV